ncbi:MAG: alpha/beta fold hydrolase [Oscillospiraceae bacterium]|nr:alpha/beta fold hydrolase [Oscillospiraceae bacterium]
MSNIFFFKKSIRRCVCLLFAAVLGAASLAPAFAQTQTQGADDQTPVILLPGYSGPQLFLDYGLPTERQIWNIPFNGDTTKTIAAGLLDVLPKLLVAKKGNVDEVVRHAGESYSKLFSMLEMNEDGSSKYNITPYPQGAGQARWDGLLLRGEERFNNQRPITNSFLDYIPAERVYLFANDWRVGQAENAAELDAFIQEVKADSGSSKVHLFGISYGGQLAAAYFHYFGDKGDVDRAVLHAPAILGSALAGELLLNEDFAFDPATILDFAAVYGELELSFIKQLEGVELSLLNEVVVKFLREYIQPLALRFGSFWDIVPTGQYEALKKKYLDPVKNAALIAKSDEIHYRMMPAVPETLRRMQRQGVKIMLLCGSGLPLASGTPQNSDYVVDIFSSSGAASKPVGESYPAGYAGARTFCADGGHRHVSPDWGVDASTCFLPEHTWFFRGQYHGQAAWDSYARALYCKWLFTDEISDIYSDPEYPQFRDSCNPSDEVEARFSGSVSGYLTEKDDALLLTNLSQRGISLLAVEAEGMDFSVSFFNPIVLQPGQTARLRYEALLPRERRLLTLRVIYTVEGAVPASESRAFAFTVLPPQENVPGYLRRAVPAVAAGPPLRPRPLRAVLLLAGAALSLCLAAAALAVMYRRRLFGEETGRS